jgi:hypothetical protein
MQQDNSEQVILDPKLIAKANRSLCWNFITIYGNRIGIGLSYQPFRLHRLVGTDSLEFIPDVGLVGIGLSYRPARLHRLAELIPWNRFLSSLKV